jgi:cell division protein FtsN
VVALMITKGSTPFTDKGHPGKAAEPTAGQVADPNKPCTATRTRRAKRPRTSRRISSAGRPGCASASGGAGAARGRPAQAMVDKIQGTQAAPAKPAAAPTPPTSRRSLPPAGGAGRRRRQVHLLLQAGAFREVADAENARAKLALLGFEANISDRTTDAGVLHRVRIGPYNQVEAMNKGAASCPKTASMSPSSATKNKEVVHAIPEVHPDRRALSAVA